MKRVLVVFLMLWLPMFMQAAWSMSTRMAVQDVHISIGLQANQGGASKYMHCHDSEGKSDVSHTKQSHHCTHCLACAIAAASASFDSVPQFYLPDSTQENTSSISVLYLSVHLPAAIKPPISA